MAVLSFLVLGTGEVVPVSCLRTSAAHWDTGISPVRQTVRYRLQLYALTGDSRHTGDPGVVRDTASFPWIIRFRGGSTAPENTGVTGYAVRGRRFRRGAVTGESVVFPDES